MLRGGSVDSEFENVPITALEKLDAQGLDALPFGVIGFTSGAIVTTYNATESRNAGLSPNAFWASIFLKKSRLV